MQWFQLSFALLAIAEQVFKSIQAAIAAGKSPTAIHAAIVDHVAATPAVVAAV